MGEGVEIGDVGEEAVGVWVVEAVESEVVGVVGIFVRVVTRGVGAVIQVPALDGRGHSGKVFVQRI